jgi:CRP-like cAMP-binding protein
MSRIPADLAASNHLINGMGRAARDALAQACEEVPLEFGDEVAQRGSPLEYVYFPLSGYISQVTGDSGQELEVALTGNEGMFGLPATLGMANSQVRGIVQGAGHALRISPRRFRLSLSGSAPLRTQLGLFTSVSLQQLIITAECSKFHSIDQRLARWLLMTADRAHSPIFRLTHQFLSYMLGVRRVGVTVAASKLQAQKVIRYTRGTLEILDFERLRAVACPCYRNGITSYDAAFGPRTARTSDRVGPKPYLS